MIPCGFAHEVASLERLGVAAAVSEAGELVARALAPRLGRELVWEREVAPPLEDEVPPDAPVRSASDLLAEAVAV
jgi:hypothetical protein